MSFIPKKIEEATAHERFTYAQKFLNLEGIDQAASDEQVIAAIRSAQPNSPNIFVEQEDAGEAAHRAEVREHGNPANMQMTETGSGDGEQQKGSLGKGDPRVTIFIRSTEQADGLGAHDVTVGVNGVVWQLQRNQDLSVPWRVVEALGLTDQDVVRHSDEGDVIITTARRVVVEFPYGMPTMDAIREWRKETDAKFCP